MESGTLDASLPLAGVVVEQAEDVFSQQDDGYQVAGCEQRHAEIDDAPYGVQREEGTQHHHHAS